MRTAGRYDQRFARVTDRIVFNGLEPIEMKR